MQCFFANAQDAPASTTIVVGERYCRLVSRTSENLAVANNAQNTCWKTPGRCRQGIDLLKLKLLVVQAQITNGQAAGGIYLIIVAVKDDPITASPSLSC